MPPGAAAFIREMRAHSELARDADRMKEFFEKLDLMGDGNPHAIQAMDLILEVLAPRNGPADKRLDTLARIAEQVTRAR